MSTFILTKNNTNEIRGRLRKALFNNNETRFSVIVYNKDANKKDEYLSSIFCNVKIGFAVCEPEHYRYPQIDIYIIGVIANWSMDVSENHKITFSGGRVIFDIDKYRVFVTPRKFNKTKCSLYTETMNFDYEDRCNHYNECYYLEKCKVGRREMRISTGKLMGD